MLSQAKHLSKPRPGELAQILRFTQDDIDLKQDDHLEIFLQQLSGI